MDVISGWNLTSYDDVRNKVGGSNLRGSRLLVEENWAAGDGAGLDL